MIESEPTVKPLTAVTAMPLTAAVPPEIEAMPRVCPPAVKVTVPVRVPAAVELTAADSVVVPPIVTELGVAVTVVVVGSGNTTVSGVAAVEAA